MSARFRIRTPQGQEISFASHEIFAEFVRSGELAPDDVVYDAETREWAPARTHPVVLQIEIEAAEVREKAGAGKGGEEEDGGAKGPAEGAPTDASGAGPSASDIGLELAPAPTQMTPEEEAAAFVAKMEAERAAELDFEADAPIAGLRMEQGSTTIGALEDLAPPPAAPADEPRRSAAQERPMRPGRTAAPPPRPPQRKKPSGSRRAYWMVAGAAAVASVLYVGSDLLGPQTSAGGEVTPDSARLPPPEPPPLIADTEEALRGRARELFLASTQTALRGLDPIPSIWLSGRYLSSPSDYPQVRTVWEEYVATVREVRASENERYRTAYLRALDDARVRGPARTLRLARATTDFQSAGAARAAHYDRVEALALAALRGHDALVEAEGTIAYEPARGPAVSADPVIEAAGRDPAAQALLEQVLDMILLELHAENGPGEAANVRAWVWEGLVAAVAG
ncbi:MAG TPA: hypothetical protein VFQ22_07640 [Longimicrobiales bacterium]|nr:hypothetical protein [Longimicrobiales bacterium]